MQAEIERRSSSRGGGSLSEPSNALRHIWGTLVDFMTVYSKEDISVTFKDGTEIHMG